MTRILNDPLLTAGRMIVMLGQALMLIGGVALSLGLPFVLLKRNFIQAEMRKESEYATGIFPHLEVAGVMAAMLIIVVLAFFFLRKLQKIIDTVADGDPFVPQNAERLTAMGWIMLGIQAMSVAIIPLVLSVQSAFRETNPSTDTDIEFSGIVLVLTLFILARVFRQGAAMRDDLEGTV